MASLAQLSERKNLLFVPTKKMAESISAKFLLREKDTEQQHKAIAGI
jgi:hypothetical protein